MGFLTVRIKNAERMMTQAEADREGVRLAFADGRIGLVPFAEIPEIKGLSDIASLELPNPYMLILHLKSGNSVEFPWDFVRHYCDGSYRFQAEAVGALGRKALGTRIRKLREKAGLTQDALASSAGIGRVTIVRIENGEQSPRFETLLSIAGGIGCSIQELLADN